MDLGVCASARLAVAGKGRITSAFAAAFLSVAPLLGHLLQSLTKGVDYNPQSDPNRMTIRLGCLCAAEFCCLPGDSYVLPFLGNLLYSRVRKQVMTTKELHRSLHFRTGALDFS